MRLAWRLHSYRSSITLAAQPGSDKFGCDEAGFQTMHRSLARLLRPQVRVFDHGIGHRLPCTTFVLIWCSGRIVVGRSCLAAAVFIVSAAYYRAASTYCCVRQSRDSGVTNTGRHSFPPRMPRFSGSHLPPFQGYNSAARHLPWGEHPTQGAKEPALGWSDFHAGPTLLEAVYGCDILESVPERASSLLCRI